MSNKESVEVIIRALKTQPCYGCEDGGCKQCQYKDYQKRAADLIEELVKEASK